MVSSVNQCCWNLMSAHSIFMRFVTGAILQCPENNTSKTLIKPLSRAKSDEKQSQWICLTCRLTASSPVDYIHSAGNALDSIIFTSLSKVFRKKEVRLIALKSLARTYLLCLGLGMRIAVVPVQASKMCSEAIKALKIFVRWPISPLNRFSIRWIKLEYMPFSFGVL